MKPGRLHALGDEPVAEGEPGYRPHGGRDPRGAFSPAEKSRHRDEKARNARDRREYERGEATDDARTRAKTRALATKARKTAPKRSRQAARAVRSPGASVTGMHLVTLSLLLVVLYWLLKTTGSIQPFLGGVANAFKWLANPHSTIPYGNAAKSAPAPGPASSATVIDQNGVVIQQGTSGAAASPAYQPPRVKVV